MRNVDWLLVVTTLTLGLSAACGNEDGGDDQSSGGGAESGGAAASGGVSGGAGTGGSPSGGSGAGQSGGAPGGGSGGAGGTTGGSTGTGGGSASGHCSPGVRLDASTSFDSRVIPCVYYVPEENGMPPGDTLVQAVRLVEPLRAGQRYGFSLDLMMAPGTSIELWGADSACGAGVEQLYQSGAHVGLLCVNLEPSQDHDYVLVVFREFGTTQFTSLTLCPTGACP